MEVETQTADIKTKPDKPEIIKRIVENIKIEAPDLTEQTITGMVLSQLSYALCAMRVQFQEYEHAKANFPNLYFAFYMASNMGKDTLKNLMKNYVMSPFQQFLDENEKKFIENKELEIYRTLKIKMYGPSEDVELTKDEIKMYGPSEDVELTKDEIKRLEKETAKELKKIKRLAVGSASAGTPEGLYSEFYGYDQRRTGAIYVQQSEAGAFADSKSERKQEFLTCLYSGYDCRIEGRTLKEETYQTIEGVPVVTEFLSDPDNVKKNASFRDRQTTALGRRLWVIMQTNRNKSLDIPSAEKSTEIRRNLISIGKELFGRKLEPDENFASKFDAENEFKFKSAMLRNYNPTGPVNLDKHTGTVLKFGEGVYNNCYIPYKKKTINLYNSTDNELQRLSISEYPFRACKVACIYALLNHPEELVINENDFEQAVKTVEELDGMRIYTGWSPEEKDKYDCIVDALIKDFESETCPDDGVYNATQLTALIDEAIKPVVTYHRRKTVRELISGDNFENTKNILKEDLLPKGYDIQDVGGFGNFKGFKMVKITEPQTVRDTENEVKELFANV